MAAIRSFLFALFFYGGTVPAVLLSFPISLLGTKAVRWWAHMWARWHRVCARFLLGVRTQIEGTPPKGACLVACKHQSMFETLEMILMLDEPATVLKRELSDIPLWGWVTRRYGVIPIDRKGGATALRGMMRAAEAAIAEGRPIAIFPEGTRVPVGCGAAAAARFRRPLSHIEAARGAVAVDSGRLWPRGRFVKRPGIVTMRILEPIEPGLLATRSRRGSTPRSTCSSDDLELGIIEGFFGRPWSWAERAAAVRFLRPHGYTFYLYAPKADPIRAAAGRSSIRRRRWKSWRSSATSAAHNVRFGIGLSPFELHLEPGRRWQEVLAARLAQLAALKPDDLALLFDDMRGDVPDLAARQAAIVHFAAERGVAERMIACPSYYSDDPILDVAFGQRPPFYLEQLGRQLDPAIRLFWTGPEVCAREFTPGHLARVAGQLGRKPFLWDNYPVNDGARMSQHLHLRGFSGRPASIAPHIAGHGVNPAFQPVLSRVPLLTLAESYKKGEAYDYLAAFERAGREILGEDLAMVSKDIIALQDRGLDRLGERKAALKARYAAFDHPAAQEILAWLEGYWSVSDELVQTQ